MDADKEESYMPNVGDIVDEPPARPLGRRPGRYQEVIDAVPPGQWVVVKVDATHSSAGSQMKASKWARAGGYQLTTRSNGDGSFTIYGRRPADPETAS